ncbi:hypothetical protein KR009_001940 [Drosophila setifemur]|nr:hypothetical protein KR009_001940 [Drosophila setifemur]
MFEIKTINIRFCRILRRAFWRQDDYGVFSIWHFCPMGRWNQAKAFILSCSPCRTEWFPVIFWLVVIFTCGGALLSLREVRRVWKCPCSKLYVWRNRRFYMFGHQLLRKARVAGSAIALFSWLLLLYGIVNISPAAMSPWILLTSVVLCGEWLLWCLEVMSGRQPIELQTLVSLVLAVLNLAMVRCVRGVFETSVRERAEHSLRII